MCQIVIPASRVRSPTRVVTDSTGTQYSDQLNSNRFPNDYGEPSLRDGDQGFGHYGAAGGTGESGNFAQLQEPINPPPRDTLWGSLDYVLTEAQKRNWKEQGSPANPNIKAAYQVCGLDYNQDGSAIQYAWCAAFISWALETAGISNLRSMSSQAYNSYGQPVQWRNYVNIRKWDIVVFKSKTRGGGHVGFIKSIDPNNQKLEVLGGNQSNTLKVSTYRFESRSQYIKEIRRNWDIPAEYDLPLVGDISASAESGASTV